MKTKFNLEDSKWILDQYKVLKKDLMMKREVEEQEDLGRSCYHRDYGRILYSSSFRRLQGKMQLLGIENDQFFRNRLTHSLEVSQIAEGIVGVLNAKLQDGKIYTEDDLYVLRGACLAHDLGNPPFGHSGEKVLNRLIKDIKGFEGNAQTLRNVRFLEKKSYKYRGLNLTFRSILALVKYNVSYDQRVAKDNEKSKFIYDEDFIFINNKLKEYKLEDYMRTLDAQIMDLSDEIAYSAHDLEDCIGLRIFNIDDLLYEFKIKSESEEVYKPSYEKLKQIISDSREEANRSRFYNSSEEFDDVLKRGITSKIINTLIYDVGIVECNEDDRSKFGITSKKQLGFLKYEKLACGLKELTYKCLNRYKNVKLYDAKGRIILERLFKLYLENNELMSPEYGDLIRKSIESLREKNYPNQIEKEVIEDIKMRYVIDYISGMMDHYAINKYNEFFGEVRLV